MTEPTLTTGVTASAAREARPESGEKKTYEPPELKEFGPMTELTQFGEGGGDEDFLLYGGPS
ncbi:MAG: hypothetical protein V2I57_02315 [Xanthomonadales bacterium]|jgi:hypothetical protein|nr:hypothetical protein [Xanthomonadales bacterium]